MKITLAKEYGLCAGVKNALKIVEETKKKYPHENIVILNKVVHNYSIIENIAKLGVTTLMDDSLSLKEKIDSINEGVIIFSAHGHDKKLDDYAIAKGLKIVDSTCPKVKINMKSIENALAKGMYVGYIGITNHPETEAALSISDKVILIDFKNPNFDKLKGIQSISIHNQTTLIQSKLTSINETMKTLVPHVEIVNDICFATTARQNSLNDVTDEDLIVIIGDSISSNSTRLYEVAKEKFKDKAVIMVSDLKKLKEYDIKPYSRAFITAGASTPDSNINPIIDYLKSCN